MVVEVLCGYLWVCLSHNRATATVRRVSFSIWIFFKPLSYARRTAVAAQI